MPILRWFKAYFLKQIKNLMRTPYFEIMLLIFTFQASGRPNIHYTISFTSNLTDSFSLKDSVMVLAVQTYFSSISGKIASLYPLIVFFSSILSYLEISYYRDIGFLKTEFSFPVKRGSMYLAKLLASCLTLSILIFSSILFSITINCFKIFQIMDSLSVLQGFLVIFIETLLIALFTSSISTLISFMVKWSGIPLVISISTLYSFEFISLSLRSIIPLFPEGLRIFEEKVMLPTIKGMRFSFSLNSFEPLFPSLLISLIVFFLGYYYVTRRMQIS